MGDSHLDARDTAREPRGHGEQPALIRSEGGLLQEAARAATSPVALREIVERFAALAIEATGGWRASIFLVEDHSLVLWANQSREPDEETRLRNWQRGISLEPIDLDEVPARRELFESGAPFPVEDARTSDLVPDAWTETFGLGALVAAPLVGGDEGLGIMVVDWPEPRSFSEHELEVVGAVAGSLTLAVHNALLTAREAERSDALQTLLEATTVLGSTAALEELADSLTAPLSRALGATGIAICLLEENGARYRTLAAVDSPIASEGSLGPETGRLRQRISRAWGSRPGPLLLTDDDVARLAPRHRDGPVLLLPLVSTDGTLLGFVLITLQGSEPPRRAVDLARALTSHLAAAIERIQLQEHLALETERLRALAALWGFEAEALEAYSAAIEDAIGPALGFNVVRVSIADEDLRSLAYFSAPDAIDLQLLDRWSRSSRTPRPLSGIAPGEVAAPLVVAGSAVGVVRARTHQGPTSRAAEMLGVIARALGRAIEQEHQRRLAREQELDLALSEERERVAARLHDTVGRLLYALNLRAATLKLAAEEGDLSSEAAQIERLARSGLASLRRTVATLASMQVDARGLVPSLERLVADFQDAHSASVSFAVDGSLKSLPDQVEEVLFQVAQEALANVERHSQAGSVAVVLDLRDEEVVLRVRDDGLGLGRSAAPAGTGLGLDLARKAVAQLGGQLDLVDSTPGVEVVVRIPARLSSIEVTP